MTLRPRIVPFLLLQGSGLVKTTRFGDPKYVGDPINTVRLFNEKQVDELVVLDTAATTSGAEPDHRTIENLAAECRMPFCYGGGIRSAESAASIVRMGVEKVAVSAAALARPDLVTRIADRIGSQSVAIVVDVRREAGGWSAWTHNGARRVETPFVELIEQVERAGAGEIVINDIDRDGTGQGYDIELAKTVRRRSRLPMTLVGGAGNLGHMEELVRACGVVGAGAGSLFIFKGVHRAVLVNYPHATKRAPIYAAAYESDTPHPQDSIPART